MAKMSPELINRKKYLETKMKIRWVPINNSSTKSLLVSPEKNKKCEKLDILNHK